MKDWETEFDEKFEQIDVVQSDWDALKSFITSLIASERANWLRSEIEKLEGMKENEMTMMGDEIRNMRKGRNVILQTIITRYKEELKVLEGK